ncbi:MAG: hypothetical protein M3461_20190, partial [Pseudomonadota bacterium]|nr:hypothetical protein [Pseudomonadota bacterium]
MYQDWEAVHASFPKSRRRVRVYPMALQSSALARAERLELTPFRGHFTFWEGGVHDVETKKCISAGVPATDGRVGPVRP